MILNSKPVTRRPLYFPRGQCIVFAFLLLTTLVDVCKLSGISGQLRAGSNYPETPDNCGLITVTRHLLPREIASQYFLVSVSRLHVHRVTSAP